MLKNFAILLWTRKFIFLFIIIFSFVLTQRFLSNHQDGLSNSISSDGLGYYCYLPALIIYQDFDNNFFGKKENNIKSNFYYYADDYKGEKLNKYYCGTAICLLPFFLLGIVISAIAGTDINGYTDTFLMLVSIASIVYFLLSIYLIEKIAAFFLKSSRVGFWLCILFFLSTNLFHYIVQEPSMSHVYTFFAISLFFYFFTRLLQTKNEKFLFFLFMSLSLVTLIRPTNICIVLFLPFFFEDLKSFANFVKFIFLKKYFYLMLSVVTFLIIVSIQFVFYYIQTGDFFILAYTHESFNFNNPQFFNILFSYKKGLFIYTPIILFLLIVVLVSKISLYKKIIFFFSFFVFTYIAASWWCWWYGGSFGNRTFIDFYPLFIIALLVLIDKISKRYKYVLFVVCLPFVFINQTMAIQYNKSIMHSYEMNKELYWDIFLETNYEEIVKDKYKKLIQNNKICNEYNLYYNGKDLSDRIVADGYQNNRACLVGESNYYSESLQINLDTILSFKNSSFYVFAEIFVKQDIDNKDLALVFSLENKNGIIDWYGKQCNLFQNQKNGWKKVMIYRYVDKSINLKDTFFKIYAMSSHNRNLVHYTKCIIIKKD